MSLNPSRDLTPGQIDSLRVWLGELLPGHPDMVAITPRARHAGNSHRLYQVVQRSRRWALRVAPAKSTDSDAAGGYDLSREYRVLELLPATGSVPHPVPVVCGASPGCPIDRDMLLCDWIDGHTLVGSLPDAVADPVSAERLCTSLVTTLAAVHETNIAGTFMEPPRQPDRDFLTRQFERGRAMLDAARVRPVTHLDQFIETLETGRPTVFDHGLIHGDYSAANIMIPRDHSPVVSCVLDWETAAAGAVLLDLGYLSARWPSPDMDPVLMAFAMGAGDRASINVLPPRELLADVYTATTGRSCLDLPFFQGLGMARLALAIETRVARAHRQGRSDIASGLAHLVDTCVAHGTRLAAGS